MTILLQSKPGCYYVSMPKALRIIAVAIVCVLVVGFGYLLLNDNSEEPTNAVSTSTQQSTTPTPPQPENEPPIASGTYVDYSADAVANAKGKRLLFFHAPWCPQCRQLDASIKSGTIPSDVTIFKVDYDSNQKLRQQYGVTIQTTVVALDDNGNEAKKYVAYEQPNLSTVLKNVL